MSIKSVDADVYETVTVAVFSCSNNYIEQV